jgi:hypothetical protein
VHNAPGVFVFEHLLTEFVCPWPRSEVQRVRVLGRARQAHNLKGEEEQELIQWINSPTNGSSCPRNQVQNARCITRWAFLRLNICSQTLYARDHGRRCNASGWKRRRAECHWDAPRELPTRTAFRNAGPLNGDGLFPHARPRAREARLAMTTVTGVRFRQRSRHCRRFSCRLHDAPA